MCSAIRCLFLTAILALVSSHEKDEQAAPPTFDENYLYGMRAYTQEDWAVCTERMQQAVKDFERYQVGSVTCLKQCESQQVSQLHHLYIVHMQYQDMYVVRVDH